MRKGDMWAWTSAGTFVILVCAVIVCLIAFANVAYKHVRPDASQGKAETVQKKRQDLFGGKCPVCVDKGYVSRVTVGPSKRIEKEVVQIYDEDGKLLTIDPSQTITDYGCDRGHMFSVLETERQVAVHVIRRDDLLEDEYMIRHVVYRKEDEQEAVIPDIVGAEYYEGEFE